MSEAFNLAGRLTLTRDEYEQWLASPSPGPESVSDWDRMYSGWFWKTRKAGQDWKPDAASIEGELQRVAGLAREQPYMVLLRYFEDKGEFWFFVVSAMGNDDRLAEQVFAIVRSAAAFKSDNTLEPVTYWPELSGQLAYQGILSLCLVGSGVSEFGDAADLAMAGHSKAELEKRFEPLSDWLSRYLEGAFEEDSSAPRPQAWARPEFIDRRFVAQ